MSNKLETSLSDDSNDLSAFDNSCLIIGICPICQKSVRMLFPIEASAITDLTMREIFRLIEDETLHFVETDEKVLMICSQSISATSN